MTAASDRCNCSACLPCPTLSTRIAREEWKPEIS